MSLLDDVSVVVTPNGYKAGTLYGVIPSSGAADMDVTRATAGTRVDENGLVNYAQVLGNSIWDGANGDTTGWTPFGSNTFAPEDGALKITYVDNAAGVYIYLRDSSQLTTDLTIGNAYIISFDTKVTSGSVVWTTQDLGGINYYAPETSSTSYINQTITIVANSTNSCFFFPRQYNSAASVFIKNIKVQEVTRDNVPRIDYTGGGCPHILAEPQRTNLLTYSEDFQNYFNVTEITLNLNYAISPDGTLNANKINFPSSSNSMYKSGLSLSGTHTVSFYVKGEGTNIGKTFDVRLQGTSVNQNLDVTITGEWVRFEAQTDGLTVFELTNRSSTTIGSGSLILFGFQIEAGSYATSYIPTSGSTVTRNQDQFTRDGIGSLINDSEGVFFLEVARQNGDVTARVISLNNGAATQNVALYYFSTGQIAFDVISSSPVVSGNSASHNTYNFNKIALKYKSGDIALWVNGVEVVTKTNTISLSGLNKISFGYGDDSFPFFGKIKQLQVYDTALTDMQLIQLTGTSGTDFYESYSEMAESLTYTIQ